MRPLAGGALALAFALLSALAGPAQAKPLVLLDPGHGGDDPGVIVDGFREADFTLDMARRTEALLKARGCDVRLTREGDQSLSLTARVAMANALQPQVLVSLHANASFQAGARGPRVFVPAETAVDEPEAPLWEQASGMHAEASHTLGLCIARGLGITGKRPVQNLKLGLFRGLSVPVSVVELEFATHKEALAQMKEDAFRQDLAVRLASGIADYVVPAPAAAAAGLGGAQGLGAAPGAGAPASAAGTEAAQGAPDAAR